MGDKVTAYIGLARKWRPQSFEDLVGQKHISLTLSNAIKAGRIGQGYLFTGTRGVGKTSAARVFAKALRCLNAPQLGSSCNQCKDCLEISEGRSIDVLEIDGASNNGVDAVREIRDNAKYLPSSGKYKIYIIDEVHMLTTAAFNALLKTLEEPPAHVIFVFATTDAQKIPATVLSRCQRFDFKRIPQKELRDRLRTICESESVTVSEDALDLLAREAEGSMRDGVSLLDQVLAVSSEKKIDLLLLTSALGLVDKQTVLDCVTGILERKPLLALEALGKVHLHGFDLKQFGREVLRFLRMIMVAQLLEQGGASANAYLDLSDVDLDDIKKLTSKRSIDDLDMLFRLLNQGLEEVARSQIPKSVMDVLLMKMASSAEMIPLAQFSEPAESVEAPVATHVSQHTPQAVSPQPTPSALAAATASSMAAAASAPRPVAAQPAPASHQQPQAPRPAAAPTAQAHAAPVAPSIAPVSSLTLEGWQKTVSQVKAQKPYLGSVLEHLGFLSAATVGSSLHITLSYTKETAFYKEQMQVTGNQDNLLNILKTCFGTPTRMDYREVNFGESVSNLSLAELEDQKQKTDSDLKKKTILESEALKATQQLLGTKLEKLDLHP